MGLVTEEYGRVQPLCLWGWGGGRAGGGGAVKESHTPGAPLFSIRLYSTVSVTSDARHVGLSHT